VPDTPRAILAESRSWPACRLGSVVKGKSRKRVPWEKRGGSQAYDSGGDGDDDDERGKCNVRIQRKEMGNRIEAGGVVSE
jgi:hypothetical protein